MPNETIYITTTVDSWEEVNAELILEMLRDLRVAFPNITIVRALRLTVRHRGTCWLMWENTETVESPCSEEYVILVTR